jgi:hypothetical protein
MRGRTGWAGGLSLSFKTPSRAGSRLAFRAISVTDSWRLEAVECVSRVQRVSRAGALVRAPRDGCVRRYNGCCHDRLFARAID